MIIKQNMKTSAYERTSDNTSQPHQPISQQTSIRLDYSTIFRSKQADTPTSHLFYTRIEP
ncbi:hypothetical protein Pan54_12700 [Rubinisphaera italica]|uniref:Uncharacterized protein n=1 Tax=Rubinisphaera italica TaxID=2527969 RepID=A0A5C5XC04_9PLAN|nr:hypothetical protein Pan54_12700 [Rubinisphaera italica]